MTITFVQFSSTNVSEIYSHAKKPISHSNTREIGFFLFFTN
ncbi:hypothetical protein EMIT079MI2_150084 [Bacillus sp. IT-79MI2]